MKGNFIKGIFVILLLYCISFARASNYYFSSVSGNDSQSAQEAQDSSTPWKTLDKLNSFSSSIQPGDTIFLKRDEIFYGSLILKSSGSVPFPITISAYGSGNRPVITSLVTLTGWVFKGNGIWESTTSLDSSVNVVLLNGIEQEMGRYPNSNAANGGYLNFESHSGNTSITDNDLNTSVNWTGAELVTRPRHWILNRSLITGQSGKTISYTTDSPYEPYEHYGFFIQNSIKTLDKLGEWYYDLSSKELSVYFGSDDPSLYEIQATTMSNLITSSGMSNIVFDNLTIKGANNSAFYISKGSNIYIQNCDILFSGVSGALVNNHTNIHIENTTISNSNNCAIDMEFGVKNAVIKNNTILNSGLFAGLIKNGEGTGLGIYSNGEGADIESNQITSAGYNGITFYGSDVIIKNNVIDRFCFVKDDGGGIYSHGGSDFPTNRKIYANVVMNGIGAGPGTDNATKRSTSGIYMDVNLWNIDISGNTVTTCFQGIFIQNSNGITVTNNTVFNNNRQLTLIQRDGNNPLRNCSFTQNNFFSRDQTQWTLYIMFNGDGIDSIGTFDYNYYARPADDGLSIFNSRITGGKTVNETMDLTGWQNRYGEDAHSQRSPITIPATADDITQSIRFEYATDETKSIALNGRYVDAAGKKYSTSMDLQPYTSIVLIKNNAQLVAPTVNITSPDNSTNFTALASLTITANAGDADGSVTRVDFYNGSVLLGSANSSPYSFNWNNVRAGDYILTAKAFDDDGLQTTSAEVLVSVTGIKTAPVISLTAPEVNSPYTAPAIITISAAATDSDGSISKVEFFNGNTLLGTVQSSPFDFTWQNVPAGNYLLTAKATDNDGLTTTSDVVPVIVSRALAPPAISMTAPAVNSTYDAPATITMSATASDADGSISKVEFFNGNTLLNSQQSPPFDFTWQNVPAGNYLISAKATDNNGLTTTSDVVTVTVTTALAPPTITLTSPAVNSTYNSPATINLSAAASDNDGSVSKVEFFNGTTLLNLQQSPPYNFTWQNVPAGNYSLTAKATDNDGLSTTSDVVSVTVTGALLPPVINMTAPAINATYVAQATISMSAAATDNDGSVSKVEFFNGTTLLNSQQSPPYNFTWQNVPAGSYNLTAKATDNDGLSTTSDVVSVTVTGAQSSPVINMTAPAINATYSAPATINMSAAATDNDGSVSKVDFFNGTTLLNSVQSPPYNFTWQNVPAGNYKLTAKATDNDGLATISGVVSVTVTAVVPPGAPVVNLTAPAVNASYTAPATITMSATATDANGKISKVEFFNGATLLNTQQSSPYSFTWKNVPVGNYSLSAKATDNTGLATTSVIVPVSVTGKTLKAPVINMTAPAVNATYTAPATVTITATATDADGKISKVEFFNGNTLLKSLSASPYTFAWKNVPAGNYTLTAKATDNDGLNTSAAVSISVTPKSLKPPVVNMTAPAVNATYTAPATITMTATATDADGKISKVEFFNGTTLLKLLSASPYTYTWKNVASGNYVLTVKATDNDGLPTTSPGRSVSVTASKNKAPTVSITKPATNTTYTAPATITLLATANDADGSISKVDFYNGSTLLKTESGSPYTYSWKNVPAGKYTITAKATDNKGLATTSASIQITVKAKRASKNSSSPESGDTSLVNGESVSMSPGSINDPQIESRGLLSQTEASRLINFRLLPNPAVNIIQLYFDGLQTSYQKANLTINNSLGEVIKRYPVIISGRKIAVDISSLSAGIYIISLSSNNFAIKKKFFKAN